MTTWNGKTATKQIQILLQTKPKLHQLLLAAEFIQQIKSYNPKLLDYITNNPWLISEAICYLTVAPQPSDSSDRKYKLPLQVIQLIETETTCILNGFFKEGEFKQLMNFDLLFSVLEKEEMLPLLAGYFFRTNLCLLNNRYKQTVDRAYSKAKIFKNLLNHSQHMAISNTIQLFLNLDINKSSTSQPDKLAIKIQVVRAIFRKIEEEGRRKEADSSARIENLCSVLIETVDKYYLILDGKQMIEVIVEQYPISVMIGLIKENNEIAFSTFSFFISLINYYSFSSFHYQDGNEAAKKSAQKLQSQPMISQLVSMFGWAMDKLAQSPKIDLYHYKLLQVLCHCISISSMRILKVICELRFFGCLIGLLFKHENCNIVHMLIEKSFYHVFISQRKIYQDYKKHLFCELDIIDLTVNRILKLFPEQNFLMQVKRKSYFGHFMRILKIYSGIQPTDESIIACIKAKTVAWNKISDLLIKPYEGICFKELGSYQDIPMPPSQQFILHPMASLAPFAENPNTIFQIEKEESFPLPHSDKKNHNDKIQENNTHNYLFDHQPQKLHMKIDNLVIEHKTSQTAISSTNSKNFKNAEPYQEFMPKKKIQSEQDFKIKRPLSKQPLKRNSRKDKVQKTQEKTNDRSIKQISQNSSKPTALRIAIDSSASSINERPNRLIHGDQSRHFASKSFSLDQIRKIKVVQIDPPKQKKFRIIEQKDMFLLQLLGIPV